MKKHFLLGILVLLMGVSCVAGCAPNNGPDDQAEKSVIETLNTLAAQAPKSVKLEIGVTVGEDTLKSVYTSTANEGGYAVEYSYQRLNPFVYEDGEYKAPEEYMSTFKGSMEISDGKIVKQDGAQTDITAETVMAFGLRFDESYFTDFTAEGGVVTAKVSKPSDFLRQSVSCSDMTLEVKYTESAITNITISYITETEAEGRAHVVYKYTLG